MKLIFKIIILLCFTLLFSCREEQSNLVTEISYFHDMNAEEDIQSIENKTFKIVSNPNLGYNNGTYWFKVRINAKNESLLNFEILESSINLIEIFANQRLIAKKNTVNTRFEISHKLNTVYYLKVHFPKQVHFPLHVETVNDYFPSHQLSLLKIGMYYGFAIMFFMINLFFYYSFKDSTFLIYCLFLLSMNIFLLDHDGLLSVWLPLYMLEHINTVSHFLVPLTGAIFATKFLNLHKNSPKSSIVATTLLTIAAIFYGIYIYTNHFLYSAIADVIGLITLSYYWLQGVFCLKKHSYATFFVIGHSLILVSIIMYIIPINWGLQINLISLSSLKFGAFFEMLLLTYSITYRVKNIQEENELIQKEIENHISVISQLEEKIDNTIDGNEKLPALKEKFSLTEREVSVLSYLAKGQKNTKIASDLDISINTVKYHSKNIYQKMNLKNKKELIQFLKDAL